MKADTGPELSTAPAPWTGLATVHGTWALTQTGHGALAGSANHRRGESGPLWTRPRLIPSTKHTVPSGSRLLPRCSAATRGPAEKRGGQSKTRRSQRQQKTRRRTHARTHSTGLPRVPAASVRRGRTSRSGLGGRGAGGLLATQLPWAEETRPRQPRCPSGSSGRHKPGTRYVLSTVSPILSAPLSDPTPSQRRGLLVLMGIFKPRTGRGGGGSTGRSTALQAGSEVPDGTKATL